MVGIGEIVCFWLIRGGANVWIRVSGIYSAWYEFKVFGDFGSTVSVFF